MKSESIASAVLRSKKFWGYFFLAAVLVALVMTLRSGFLEDWGTQVVQSLIGGTVAAVFLSVLIHLGMVLDADDIHEETRNRISEEIEGRSNDIVKRVGEKFEARYKWGLHSVVDTIREGEELNEVENSKVKWMNTKFQDPALQTAVIREAVRRGCNVKLLLMHPDSDMIKYRGMYTVSDFKCKSSVDHQEQDYRDSARTSAREMLKLYKELSIEYPQIDYKNDANSSEDDEITPGFQMRFYMDTPAIPMLIWKGEYLKRGFTGFYLNSYSRIMPYLGWQGEDTEMLNHLFDYFDRKWFFSESFDASKLDRAAFSSTHREASKAVLANHPSSALK